jgi:hypothetical protein
MGGKAVLAEPRAARDAGHFTTIPHSLETSKAASSVILGIPVKVNADSGAKVNSSRSEATLAH